MAPSALLPEPTPFVSSKKYNDFRDDLFENGFAVVKGAIPHSKAIAYEQRAHDWVTSLSSPEFSFDDPSTWHKDNLPVQHTINAFMTYCVAHEKFMWDIRTEPGVIAPFAKIWGTDELLVSFDALNITFPNRKDIPRKESWEHIDQSPMRKGLQCIQGIVQLSEAGDEDGGLIVYPGSHRLTPDFFETETDKSTWEAKDWYSFKEHIGYFTSRGIKPLKVNASPGDVILWDSRTIHYGSEPTEKGNTIRTIIYAAYTPAKLATEEALKIKAEIFEAHGGTTHWPHDNIIPRIVKAIREDGTQDPKDRTEPFELPERSDKVLKLAGVKPYSSVT